MPRLFEQALADIVQAGADAIAVTGDLLDVPDYILTHDDYYDYRRDLWATEIEADYRLFQRLLDATGLPYVVLPGNHDELSIFERMFPWQPVLEVGGHRLVSFRDRDFYAHVPRRFDRERLLFESMLGSDGPPQVHLQHYVITPELNQGWPHTYLEGEELRRKIVESGRVALSLSGHYHLGTELLPEGPCTFTTCPAFGEFPHRYRLYDLTADGVTMTEVPLLQRPQEAGRRVVFLDRDGVLNVQPWWRTGPNDLLPMPGAGPALRRLSDAGYVLIGVSSQSAVGAGYVTPHVVDSVFDWLARTLWQSGAALDAFYYSTGAMQRAVHPQYEADPHGKPKPDYLLQAAERFGLELEGSYMVGDSFTDLQAGAAAGVRPILVRTGGGTKTEELLDQPDAPDDVMVVDDIVAAAEWILRG